VRFARFLLLATILIATTSAGMADDTAGPFTIGQVIAGRRAFLANCTNCHGAGMTGGGSGAPALTGPNFQEDWLNKSAGQLFRFASTNMPLNFAGMLPRDTYVNLVSFILAVNGAEPGPDAFTGNSDVRISTVADGRTVPAVLNGEGPYATRFPAPAKKRR
jgi:mono/diheme cytochrome c family protein